MAEDNFDRALIIALAATMKNGGTFKRPSDQDIEKIIDFAEEMNQKAFARKMVIWLANNPPP